MTERVNFERQLSIFDPEIFGDRQVDIYGGGGVGGKIAIRLAKQRIHRVRVCDDKIVGPHNPPNQEFTERQVGMKKVGALQQIARFNVRRRQPLITEDRRVSGNFRHGDVVFMCVDTMEARRQIMRRLFRSKRPPLVVIETRIDTNNIVVQTFIPSNRIHQERYWQYWFPDREGENDGGCDDKRALGCASGLAAEVAISQLIQWFGNGKRDLASAPDNQIRVRMRPWRSEAYQW